MTVVLLIFCVFYLFQLKNIHTVLLKAFKRVFFCQTIVKATISDQNASLELQNPSLENGILPYWSNMENIKHYIDLFTLLMSCKKVLYLKWSVVTNCHCDSPWYTKL